MDEPIVVTSTVAPIELAAEKLSENLICVVSSFKKFTNNNLSLVYWNMVDISKQIDKNELYLEDTICDGRILSLQDVSYPNYNNNNLGDRKIIEVAYFSMCSLFIAN